MPIDPTQRPLLPPTTTRTGKAERVEGRRCGTGALNAYRLAERQVQA